MNDSAETCTVCLRPKKSQEEGSLTQWISICQCDVLGQVAADLKPVLICAACGKRCQEKRSKSFTQWILRADTCQCEHPDIKRIPHRVPDSAPLIEAESPLEEHQFLQLDPARFPVDRYKPISVLGSGAAGKVYLCLDALLSKYVAVKTLGMNQPEALIAFQSEARALSRLNHPNIVTVLDFGIIENTAPYMVLEYVPGSNLMSILEKKETLSVDQCLQLFSQTAEALSHAHSNDILHRDLKPSNILVIEDGDFLEVRIIDFGLTRVKQESGLQIEYQERTIVGTPFYMCPDMIRGEEYTASSDLYSLGCVIYETLVGRPPYEGKTALETLSKHINLEIPDVSSNAKVDVPDDLRNLILSCLAKTPGERINDARDLKKALDSIETQIAAPEETSGISETTARSSKTLAIAALMILLVIASGTIWLMNFKQLQKQAPHTSIHEKIKTNLITTESENERIKRKYANDTKTSFIDLHFQIVDDNVVDAIGHLPLTELDISYTQITDSGLKEIAARIKTLRLLKANGLKLSSDGISALKGLPKLTIVDFSRAEFKDDIMDALSELTPLKEIRMQPGIDIDKLDFGKLNRLPHLSTINLNGSEVDFASFSRLQNPSLEFVHLARTGLKDQDIPNILRMRSTKALFVEFCPITDKGLQALASLKSLRLLDITGCKNVTPEGVHTFRKEKPECRVRRKEAPKQPSWF